MPAPQITPESTRPQLSLNGTSVKQLLEQQQLVLETARALRAALHAAYPHGRDYQYNPAALEKAPFVGGVQIQDVEEIVTFAWARAEWLASQQGG